jgi:hypothetical protein
MELPEDVLDLIREFAQPLTRPNWRYLHLWPLDLFYLDFYFCPYYHTEYGEIVHFKNMLLLLDNDGFVTV